MTPSPVALPDKLGRYGPFGGRYVPETLMAALEELEQAWQKYSGDAGFLADVAYLARHYVGRPSPVTEARRLTAHYGRGRVALKREDLNHTGSHKINNALGQVLLAKRMGKTRIIAETGAGQHGVATATACALAGLPCIVYQGREDMERQKLNVFRMRLLGAEVRGVDSGTRTLKDALNEALRDWVGNVESTHYVIGSVAGPHPFPALVRDLQAVVGVEARGQCLEQFGRLPSHVVACVGGGSNALGSFHAFRPDADVALIGVEAAGHGLDSGQHSATLAKGSVGVLHGSRSYVLQDDEGQIQGAHSIAPGLDYPGVGPEHAYLKDTGRARYETVTDDEALDAFVRLSRLEGIIPALESAHAVAYLEKLLPATEPDDLVLVTLSGRGDKDVQTVMPLLEARGDVRMPRDEPAGPGQGAVR